ncbi:hypothetical protein PCE1_003910 [Barthelona sp. PCE]
MNAPRIYERKRASSDRKPHRSSKNRSNNNSNFEEYQEEPKRQQGKFHGSQGGHRYGPRHYDSHEGNQDNLSVQNNEGNVHIRLNRVAPQRQRGPDPRKLLIIRDISPVIDKAHILMRHFSIYGEITGSKKDNNDGSTVLEFTNQSDAECAFRNGKLIIKGQTFAVEYMGSFKQPDFEEEDNYRQFNTQRKKNKFKGFDQRVQKKQEKEQVFTTTLTQLKESIQLFNDEKEVLQGLKTVHMKMKDVPDSDALKTLKQRVKMRLLEGKTIVKDLKEVIEFLKKKSKDEDELKSRKIQQRTEQEQEKLRNRGIVLEDENEEETANEGEAEEISETEVDEQVVETGEGLENFDE